VAEGNEICDDGNDDNNDECLNTCVAASCGDGFVQTGIDQCDDANVDDADGCLSTCSTAIICDQILTEIPDAADGVYSIDPDGEGPNPAFDAYCDMSNDDGGWTLVAKVHRWHMGDSYDEPAGWFAEARDTDALLDTISYEDRPEALAAHGATRLGPALPDMSVARFTTIAEDDADQVATWFKGIDGEAFSWFSQTAHAATPVCEDPELMLNCTNGTILQTGLTGLGGMTLADYGYQTGCEIHMRLNEDGGAAFSAVCSCTQNLNNNAWHDDAADGHWGNGLEVWFR
jgi:cysteine-rich repeat protein